MSKATDIEILEATTEIEPLPFRTPLKFGGRVVSDVDILNVTVKVRNGQGKEASGFGSMPVGNVWAWPSQVVDAEDSAQAMKQFAPKAAKAACDLKGLAHPMDHGQGSNDHFSDGFAHRRYAT